MLEENSVIARIVRMHLIVEDDKITLALV